MMLMRIILSITLLLPMASPAIAASDDLQELRGETRTNEWVPARNDDKREIRTWAKQEDGKRIRSFKIDAVVDSSIEAIGRLHTDMENMPRWYWETLESKMLKQVSKTEYYYYMRFNAPLGLPDRDGAFHAVIEPYSAKRGYMLLRVNAVPDYIPARQGIVRVISQDFVVKLTPQGKNRTRFESEGYVDPGGMAPAWTVNFVQRRVPYLIMVSMMRMLQSKEYTELTSPSAFTFVEP